MGYLFLALALAAGITKGFCGKKTSFAIKSSSDSMIINILRMLACIFIGFALMVVQGDIMSLKASGGFIDRPFLIHPKEKSKKAINKSFYPLTPQRESCIIQSKHRQQRQ